MQYSRFFNQLCVAAYESDDGREHVAPRSPSEIDGWMDDGFGGVIDAIICKKPGFIEACEVGSWLGKSADCIASRLKGRGRLICIDTWLGAPEFWTQRGLVDKTRGVALKRRGGYPTVFFDFVNNMKMSGHTKTVAPFPLSSQAAADVLQRYDATFDFVYIDASHEYESVLADIKAYAKLVKPGGFLIGDDYFQNWPGVIKAVDEFAEEQGYRVDVSGVIWKIQL